MIDERFNGGGQIADYIIDNLSRPLTELLDDALRARISPRRSRPSSGRRR